MEKVLVLGSGKIGMSIAQSLMSSGDYALALGDADEGALDKRAPEGAETLIVEPLGARRFRHPGIEEKGQGVDHRPAPGHGGLQRLRLAGVHH